MSEKKKIFPSHLTNVICDISCVKGANIFFLVSIVSKGKEKGNDFKKLLFVLSQRALFCYLLFAPAFQYLFNLQKIRK